MSKCLTASILVFAVFFWSILPAALGGTPQPVSSASRVDLDVPIAVSTAPGWTTGDTAIRIPDLFIPGDPNETISRGWKLTTNYRNGYEVHVRSTTSPALRGSNAINGEAAKDSFGDFSSSDACPCSWDTKKAKKGVFGYSVDVNTTSGAPAVAAERWGTAKERKWRGFTREPFLAYSTAGGDGSYDMTLYFRSEIPSGTVQEEGAYRAGVVVSTHPLL